MENRPECVVSQTITIDALYSLDITHLLYYYLIFRNGFSSFLWLSFACIGSLTIVFRDIITFNDDEYILPHGWIYSLYAMAVTWDRTTPTKHGNSAKQREETNTQHSTKQVETSSKTKIKLRYRLDRRFDLK